MPGFRRTDRDFSENLFRNAERQESQGSLVPESRKEFLVDLRTGEAMPVHVDSVTIKIVNGFPVSVRETGTVVLDCGHKPCGLSQVLGRCRHGHVICDKCELYTCALNGCGQKICDLDVLMLEDGSTVCLDHEKDVRRMRMVDGVVDTLKYLCGWSGPQLDDE